MNISKYIGSLFITVVIMSMISSCVSATEGKSRISGRDQVEASGNIVTKSVELSSDFSGISVLSIIDVVVTQGNADAVKIVGSDNLIKYCDVSLNGKTLNINLSKEADNISFKKFDVKVYITSRSLNNVSISGTGDVNFKEPFNTSILNINISGTGDLTIPALIAADFNVNISGTGDVKAKGSCNSASFDVSGTGDIDADLKITNTLKASVSGTGDIELSGTVNTAEYIISGTGDIEAKNMIAKSVKASSAGTGDIDCYASESFSGSKTVTGGLKCYGNPAKYNMKKD